MSRREFYTPAAAKHSELTKALSSCRAKTSGLPSPSTGVESKLAANEAKQ